MQWDRVSKQGIATLKDELAFPSAVQSYIWALPADVIIGPRASVFTEKSPMTSVDARGDCLSAANSYRLTLPQGIPVALFWSITVYDPVLGSGLAGQLAPSINTMDRPATNPDGSTDIYFGPSSPGEGRNWLRTLPHSGFLVILRLYGPTRGFSDQTWRPGDLEKLN